MNRSGSFRVWLNAWMFINALAFAGLLGIGVLGAMNTPKLLPGDLVLVSVGVSGLITTGLLKAAGSLAATAADDLGRLVQLQTDLNGALKRARA